MDPAQYLAFLQREQGMELAPTAAAIEKKLRPRFKAYFTELSGGDAVGGEKMLQAHFEELREIQRACPTPYEVPSSYAVMMDLAKRVETAARTVFSEETQIPLFGTLPIGELNAMAIAVPESDQHLIAFQQGVFGFANLLTKAVAASLPVTTREDGWLNFSTDLELVEKGWEEDDGALRRLDEFLAAYLLAGNAHAAEQYFIPSRVGVLSQILCEAFELFIFGHELGHVVAGHLDTSANRVLNLGPTEVELLSPDWAEEFEADHIGFALALQAMGERKLDAALSYVGIDLFFSSIELVTRALTTLAFGEARPAPASKTHPPPALRREMVRSHLDQLSEEQAATSRHLAVAVEQLLEMMWTRIAPVFESRHEKGLRPTGSWR